MPDPFKRPYLDANVYISAFKGPTTEPAGRAETSAQILKLAEQGQFQIAASTFLYTEVIRVPGTGQIPANVEATITGYLEREFIAWIEVDLPLARKARELARQHGLKPADAVHLATAIRANCDQLMTWDRDDFHKGRRTIE